MSIDDETIYPTHQCFDDIADFLNDLAARRAPRELLLRHTVVHGICLKPPCGEPYAHGWIEYDGYAISAGIYKGERIFYRTSVDDFRLARCVFDETRYTLNEVLVLDKLAGDDGFPPYRRDYKALCLDRRPELRSEPSHWVAPRQVPIEAWPHAVPYSAERSR